MLAKAAMQEEPAWVELTRGLPGVAGDDVFVLVMGSLGTVVSRTWRIPRFQVSRQGRLLRGIETVMPCIRPCAHPLAVARWFTSPHQDLVAGGEEMPVTPLAWLSAGRDPVTVAELAREI